MSNYYALKARCDKLEAALRTLLREHDCGRYPIARDWSEARGALQTKEQRDRALLCQSCYGYATARTPAGLVTCPTCKGSGQRQHNAGEAMPRTAHDRLPGQE